MLCRFTPSEVERSRPRTSQILKARRHAPPPLFSDNPMPDFLPQLIQQLFNGLSLGAIYALIAIGYTMVYGIIGMINFAHGEIYMIGAYVGLITLSAIGTQSGLPMYVIIGLMLLVAVVITGVYGFVVEQVAYKPVRHGRLSRPSVCPSSCKTGSLWAKVRATWPCLR